MSLPFSKRKVDASATEAQLVQIMMNELKVIYSNHSSDEYKSRGDITKTSEYHNIEKRVSGLPTLKGFPSGHAREIKTMFDTLHRPVFCKMVTEYIQEPNDQNVIFTALYTTGFRVLIGELARIYASTEATKKGIVYKPDKVSRKKDMYPFIRVFNETLEKKINDYIKTTGGTSSPRQESYMYQEAGIEYSAELTGVSGLVVHAIVGVVNSIATAIKALNPISLINSILMSSYDRKVAKFKSVSALYDETKKAYDEYMRIPEAQRNEKVASKYVQDMEKYNIKMENLKAEISHYDQRSESEAKEKESTTKGSSSSPSTPKTGDDSSSSTDDFDF